MLNDKNVYGFATIFDRPFSEFGLLFWAQPPPKLSQKLYKIEPKVESVPN